VVRVSVMIPTITYLLETTVEFCALFYVTIAVERFLLSGF
jgi:hypothetical protein